MRKLSSQFGIVAALLKDRQRLPEVTVEQVDLRGERERGAMVAKPALHLDGVAAFREQDRGAGVAEGVEAYPGKLCGLTNRLEHSPEDVVGHERRAVRGGETGSSSAGHSRGRAVLSERRGKLRTPVAARNQKNRCHWSGTSSSTGPAAAKPASNQSTSTSSSLTPTDKTNKPNKAVLKPDLAGSILLIGLTPPDGSDGRQAQAGPGILAGPRRLLV